MAIIRKITSFSDPMLDVYARLTEGQLKNRAEPEKGLFIAESPNVIDRALDGGYEPVSLLMEGKHIEGQAKHIVERCGDIPLYTAPLDVLTELTGFPLTRGVLCAMRRKPLRTVDEVCAGARRIAVLEDVQNPTNVGAIFRSAAALGMDAVLLTPMCSDPLYRRAVRVSMGTVFQIPWTRMDAPAGEECHRALQALGFQTVALALTDDSLPIDAPELAQAEKLALILGTEGDGLRTETITASDFTAKIPMSHGVDSLNVAAASAVAFWQLGHHRRTE